MGNPDREYGGDFSNSGAGGAFDWKKYTEPEPADENDDQEDKPVKPMTHAPTYEVGHRYVRDSHWWEVLRVGNLAEMATPALKMRGTYYVVRDLTTGTLRRVAPCEIDQAHTTTQRRR